MRSSVIANVVLAAASALIAGGALGCDACKKKNEEAREAEKSSLNLGEREQTGETGETAFGKGQTPRADFMPITTAEVAPLIPSLTGAATLSEATVVAGGRRVNVVQCITNDPKVIQAEFEKKLGEIGFTGYQLNKRPRKDMNFMRAEINGIRVSAALRTNEYPDCPASQKKTKLFLTYFKRTGIPGKHHRAPSRWDIPRQRQQPGAAAPGAPGAATPGAPGATPPAGTSPTPPVPGAPSAPPSAQPEEEPLDDDVPPDSPG